MAAVPAKQPAKEPEPTAVPPPAAVQQPTVPAAVQQPPPAAVQQQPAAVAQPQKQPAALVAEKQPAAVARQPAAAAEQAATPATRDQPDAEQRSAAVDPALLGKSKDFIKAMAALSGGGRAVLTSMQGSAAAAGPADPSASDLLDFLTQLGLQGLYYKVLCCGRRRRCTVADARFICSRCETTAWTAAPICWPSTRRTLTCSRSSPSTARSSCRTP